MKRHPNKRLIAMARWWGRVAHGQGVRRVRLDLDDGTEVALRVPRQQPNPVVQRKRRRAAHSPDFATVRWGGKVYRFAHKQRAVVRMLWRAWQRGTPDVDQQTLLAEAESDCGQLRDLFRRHKAWTVMIVAGERAGTYRIADEPRPATEG